MKLAAFEAVVQALHTAQVRYLVADGLAVNAHGSIRLTMDIDIAREYAQAQQGKLLPGIVARFVSIPTLIRMKQAIGRPRDLDDIQHLSWIQENKSHD